MERVPMYSDVVEASGIFRGREVPKIITPISKRKNKARMDPPINQ